MATFGGTPRSKVPQVPNRDTELPKVIHRYSRRSGTREFVNLNITRPYSPIILTFIQSTTTTSGPQITSKYQ